MLWIVLFLVVIMFWWWSSRDTRTQGVEYQNLKYQDLEHQGVENPENGQVITDEPLNAKPKVEGTLIGEKGTPSSAEAMPLDEDVAEFKYSNLKRLMSTRMDTLDEYQIAMVVQQILNELPEMVGLGKMHPFDATFAHIQAMARQGHELQALDVEAIRQNYIDIYPFSINSGVLELH